MKALPLPTPTGIYCYICRDQEVSTVATRLCNERRKPVCPKHAAGCYEDGHGTSELESPMSEKLTDAEVICAWMEPKPEGSNAPLQTTWWRLSHWPDRNGNPDKDHPVFVPRDLSLDDLWEVEERLRMGTVEVDDLPDFCFACGENFDNCECPKEAEVAGLVDDPKGGAL